MDQDTVTIEHKGAMAAVGLAYQMLAINTEPLRRLVDAAERIESVGIVFDPTLLRDFINSENAKGQVRIARLVLKFVGEMRREIAALPATPGEVG